MRGGPGVAGTETDVGGGGGASPLWGRKKK